MLYHIPHSSLYQWNFSDRKSPQRSSPSFAMRSRSEVDGCWIELSNYWVLFNLSISIWKHRIGILFPFVSLPRLSLFYFNSCAELECWSVPYFLYYSSTAQNASTWIYLWSFQLIKLNFNKVISQMGVLANLTWEGNYKFYNGFQNHESSV
jgi:hypothetical protein